jgi:hypothetical protein
MMRSFSRAAARATAVLAVIASLAPIDAAAQQGNSTLRVTVRDETQAVLIHAIVTVIDAKGVEYPALVNQSGEAAFAGLGVGTYQIRVEAEGFQGYTVPYNVRRGANTAVATLPVAMREDIVVNEQTAEVRRDNGFTRTLSKEEIDGLSDDPEEMAEQLRQMAGPGAQIFVDGFRGGRIPPKDQIQQIRFFSNSFSAEYHEAGMIRVEIITKPGMGGWGGNFNFGFRDESLNARNAFAPIRGPEQQKRFMLNFQGPVWKGKTGLAISADGNMSYDARTIVASTPDGTVIDQIRRPVDAVNANVRLEHSLGAGNTLRAEYARRADTRRNLGVGDFDLMERAFETESATDTLRLRNTRVMGKKVFSELKFELVQSQNTTTSASMAPVVRVLDAFTAGGAGQAGTREGRQWTLAQNFDFSIAKHLFRGGVQIDGSWWDSNQQTNVNGTFTFSNLDDFLAGRPRQYSRRVGDPNVRYSQYEAGWFIQDDFRVSKNFNVSLGVRQELQTHVDDKWNVAPRAAFTWTWGRANVRGGYGIFYDWLESNTYENLDLTSGTRLAASRIQLGPDLSQPTIQQASIGYERPLTPWATFRADYMMTRASEVFRASNINVPINGVRPDPTAGNITEIDSTGRRAADRVNVNVSLRRPSQRMNMNVMYMWSNTRSHSDSPLALPADSTNPDADWGPSSMDVRHRVNFMFNAPLPAGVRASMQANWSSAMPYTITTGRDDNGDTSFNDRPAGVGRNSARGADQWNVNLRVNRSFSLGGMLGSGPVMIGGPPPPPPPPPSGASAQRAPEGGGGQQIMIMDGAMASRYRLDLYVQVFNLFNTTNLNQFIGNQLSPYFGQATSAAAPRRIELGASISF